MRISDWSSDVCSSDLNVDAQHLGDHTDRKQRGKFPDEIELALAAMLPDDIIDQFMRDTADAVLHCPDPAGHERFVRQLADADMTRRIERNHRLHFGHWIIVAQQDRKSTRLNTSH